MDRRKDRKTNQRSHRTTILQRKCLDTSDSSHDKSDHSVKDGGWTELSLMIH